MQNLTVRSQSMAVDSIGKSAAHVLAATLRRPWPIVSGILVATLANHAAAGALVGLVAQALGPPCGWSKAAPQRSSLCSAR